MIDSNIDRTSHQDIVENPDVQSFLKSCNFMKEPTGRELDEVVRHFVSVPKCTANLPQNIISIDGSNYEASVREELPFTRVGFVKISNLLIKRSQFKKLSKGGFVDPFEVADLSKDNTSLTFSLPSSNLRYKGEESVRDGFRRALDEALYNCRFDDADPTTSLRTTLFCLAALRNENKTPTTFDKLRLYKCPSCGQKDLELWDIPEVQHCPHCGKVIYPSDCLRIWEDIGASGSNQSALTRFTNSIMHMLIVHYIRFLRERNPNSYLNVLSNLCFIVNGPLAIFGNPAWIHSSIMKYLYDVNKELVQKDRSPIMVMGILKSGPVCDYFKMIAPSIPINSIFGITDSFRDRFINYDRDPSATTFGAETYYGQDFLLKTSSGKLFAFDVLLPFRDKHDTAVFKIEKANISNFENIGSYIKLIEEFECDLYSTTLVPVALAQKYAAISLEPGGRVLDLLVKNALS